ncbi:IS110 family transposase [Archangium gephyra]|uniref:IS110 family transposase n=1 Tax=Archangium gephyra TaxID=48 RepID=UPI003B81D357
MKQYERYAGIDIGAEKHAVAVVDAKGGVERKPLLVSEDQEGYGQLWQALGPAEQVLVAMEATGHYWRNLVAALLARGYAVALINPLRTHRYAGEDLRRAKTDALDALSIARFAQEKRLQSSHLPDSVLAEAQGGRVTA